METMKVRTHSEIHRGGPHAGKRVWVREWIDARGRCDRFEIFAVAVSK